MITVLIPDPVCIGLLVVNLGILTGWHIVVARPFLRSTGENDA